LEQITNPQPPAGALAGTNSLPYTNGYSENAHRLLESLDSTFSETFRTLQQDLTSYQSPLSQQLNRMQSQEQQVEAILAALIQRLREQLQSGATRQPIANLPPIAPAATPIAASAPLEPTIPLSLPATPLPPPVTPKRQLSNFQLGMLLVLLSTIALSFHNVVVRVIGNSSTILGLFQTGGFIKLGFGNSLLILWLRMLVVLPLMIPVAMVLYPAVWRDVKKFLTDRDRRPLVNVLLSGASLFLSQILIYVAIGQIGPGAAVTILFMYPIITVPLAWLLFSDRPTLLRWVVMGIIAIGVILTSLPSLTPKGAMSGVGVMTAVAAGVGFAFYLIFMQLGFKKLHPVPVSLIQFSTIFVLSSLMLMLPIDLGVQIKEPSGFLISGVVLGILTLVGYLANNFGVRFMGAARASIIASSGPVVTALLAFLIINSSLKPEQWLGILLVTAGVTALSFERLKGQPAPNR
jgi:drug/metabolite transporter (DMT)-like permease